MRRNNGSQQEFFGRTRSCTWWTRVRRGRATLRADAGACVDGCAALFEEQWIGWQREAGVELSKPALAPFSRGIRITRPANIPARSGGAK